jgi:hypothetical protein
MLPKFFQLQISVVVRSEEVKSELKSSEEFCHKCLTVGSCMMHLGVWFVNSSSKKRSYNKTKTKKIWPAKEVASDQWEQNFEPKKNKTKKNARRATASAKPAKACLKL